MDLALSTTEDAKIASFVAEKRTFLQNTMKESEKMKISQSDTLGTTFFTLTARNSRKNGGPIMTPAQQN